MRRCNGRGAPAGDATQRPARTALTCEPVCLRCVVGGTPCLRLLMAGVCWPSVGCANLLPGWVGDGCRAEDENYRGRR